MFVSASWDGTVQGWDDRTCGSVWQHAGTNVAGADGLCIDPIRNFVLTGSYKHDKTLSQVWEARIPGQQENRKSSGSLDKPLSVIAQDATSPSIQIYVSRISADNQCIIFGGTNGNIVKLLNATTLRPLATITNLATGVYSADSCLDPLDKKRLIIGFTNGSKVHLILVDPRQPNFSDSH
ncbi:hypothetical protein PHET_07481 [Paragonimus heterotremus]|uniref:Uncharacterized protein n=1 Tax=Paragonimus heterotremus TaxID=100268 RepID=A0A8J4TCN9_9TREM|nr:hypothetical protein PHET_07481 [Paragonimus heterotremus]